MFCKYAKGGMVRENPKPAPTSQGKFSMNVYEPTPGHPGRLGKALDANRNNYKKGK